MIFRELGPVPSGKKGSSEIPGRPGNEDVVSHLGMSIDLGTIAMKIMVQNLKQPSVVVGAIGSEF